MSALRMPLKAMRNKSVRAELVEAPTAAAPGFDKLSANGEVFNRRFLKHCGTHSIAQRSRGQAMIEYLIVLSFGVIVLMQGGTEAPFKKLATAIKDYHKHFTYAMAIATIPDCDYQMALDKSTTLSDMVTLTGGATVGFDRCIDWTNPQIPALSVTNLAASIGLVPDVKSFVSGIVTNMISSYIDSFVNPSGLLDDMLNFSPSDFF